MNADTHGNILAIALGLMLIQCVSCAKGEAVPNGGAETIDQVLRHFAPCRSGAIARSTHTPARPTKVQTVDVLVP